MQKLPNRIRLDQRYTGALAGAAVLALIVGAFVPEDYAIGCIILGVCGLLGAAYMVTLDVAVFTKDSVVISGTAYPFARIASVDWDERLVTVPRPNGRSYQVIQPSLILHPPGDSRPRIVDIKKSRGGPETVVQALRAHLARYRSGDGP